MPVSRLFPDRVRKFAAVHHSVLLAPIVTPVECHPDRSPALFSICKLFRLETALFSSHLHGQVSFVDSVILVMRLRADGILIIHPLHFDRFSPPDRPPPWRDGDPILNQAL
jgi:hypothetical protein